MFRTFGARLAQILPTRHGRTLSPLPQEMAPSIEVNKDTKVTLIDYEDILLRLSITGENPRDRMQEELDKSLLHLSPTPSVISFFSAGSFYHLHAFTNALTETLSKIKDAGNPLPEKIEFSPEFNYRFIERDMTILKKQMKDQFNLTVDIKPEPVQDKAQTSKQRKAPAPELKAVQSLLRME